MEESTWNKIIDALASLNYCGRISPHLYGEPLLDERLPALIDYARKKCPNAYIAINTNGDLLNESLFKRLLAKGADALIVTNYDREEKLELELLAKRYPLHMHLRNCGDFKIVNRAGKIFDQKITSSLPCLRPASQLIINWKGEVLLCCNDFYARYVMGAIAEESIPEIWKNQKFGSYRNDLRLGHRSKIEICRFCDDPGKIPW